MLKFENRCQNGKLKPKDLNSLIANGLPESVYEFSRGFWKVDVPSPRTIATLVDHKGTDDFDECCIKVGVKRIDDLRETYEKVGRKLSGEHLLKMILAENFSLYASYRSVPENFNCDFSFYQPETYSLADLDKLVSVATQIASIGEIGCRAMERHLGIYDHDKNCEAFKVLFSGVEKKIRPNEKREMKKLKESIKTVKQIKLSSTPMAKNALEKMNREDEKNIDECLQSAIAGTTMLYVADVVEKRYEDRFPQLIVKTFGTVDEYIGYFKAFVGEYMPTFGDVMEEELSLFKK